MTPIIVIPARMASGRFPGKPLADIHGRPMIVRVLDRARATGIGTVAVACGDQEIADAVRAAGGTSVLTDPDLPSGSDRVHAALATLDPEGRHDVVLNLQGDVPTVTAEQMRAALRPLADPAIDIGTVVAPIESEEEARTPSFVKAVCAFAEGAETA
ncbi:MAG: NTP transferase domain-containing protein, partial [Acetobacteraceae bacterium]